jgi:hypothetical protein
MSLAIVLQLIMYIGFSDAPSTGVAATECPLAVLSCRRESADESKFDCAVTAQMPSPKYAPQYEWSVSAGKLESNRKPNVTIDGSGTRATSIRVTVLVHWKNVPRICDRSLDETIQLNQRSR